DRPRIAVFDLTDCEGCELEFLNLKEKLVDLLGDADIVNWRLAKEVNKPGPFEISFIEGTPVSAEERALLKEIRDKSKFLVALGSCACLGGVPAIVEDRERGEIYKRIYPPWYKPQGTEARPIDAYVKVDYHLSGCPVDKKEIERVLTSLLLGKTPEQRNNPVCLECKVNDNRCFLANDEPCLGPITKGGCSAFCTSRGKLCVGCYGLVKDANFDRMVERLDEIQDGESTRLLIQMFLSETGEYKKRYSRK
ncbi:MAG: NADH:ubiquinone oxidoreductase, partial [Candidatus Altiarchaeota archaeon]|nr:NADH:ubiquinone oxidoreductase [Candidatus Altiarchaeota archaeon]